MTRFTLLLLGSALMLMVAACDAGGDDVTDDPADEPTEEQASDSGNGDTDVATPEDDAETDGTATEETEESDDSNDEGESGDTATPENGDTAEGEGTPGPEATQPANEGIFFDLSFEEANELTDFDLREPEEVPEDIEFQTITAFASPEATGEQLSEEATTVTMSYTQPTSEEMPQGLPLEFTQTSEMDMTEGLPEEAEQESVSIEDRDVTRVTLSQQGGEEIVAYMWQDGDIYFSLAAVMGPELEESTLESIVASVPTS